MEINKPYKQRSVMSIFIASPGDVQKERRITYEVVDRINRHIARNLGVSIELRGWEDTLPGFARPQQKINEDLIECDLFIGLLWKRWGTPSGKYSSGFEEEFNLALELQKESKLKDIWLFFRDMPLEVYQDPGDQAKKVLEFRKQVEAQREVLYQTYDNETKWEKIIYDTISDYITRSFIATQESTEIKGETETSIKLKDGLLRAESAIHLILESLKSKNFENLSNFEISRANLAVQAIYYSRTSINKSQVIDSHDLHFLYNNKASIKLNSLEKLTILRTLLGDSENTKAGWYWPLIKPEYEESILIDLINDKSNQSIQITSIELLAAINKVRFREIAFKIIKSDDLEMSKASFRLLEEQIIESDLEFLESYLANGDIQNKDIWLYIFKALIKLKPEAALSLFLKTTYYNRKFDKSDFEVLFEKVDNLVVEQLLKDEDLEVKYLTIQVLGNKVATSSLILYSTSDDITLALLAYEELLSRGIKVNEDHLEILLKKKKEVIEKQKNSYSSSTLESKLKKAGINQDDLLINLYKQKPLKYLLEQTRWTNLKGHLYYAAIINKNYNKNKKLLISDINNQFSRFEEDYFKIISEVYSEDHAKESIIKYGNFIRGYYMKESLKILSVNFSNNDLTLIRSLLARYNENNFDSWQDEIVEILLNIISIHGDASDVKLIMPIIGRSLTKSLAVKAILLLSKNSNIEIISELLESKDIAIKQYVIYFIITNNISAPIEIIKKFLYHENENLRQSAVLCLSLKLTNEDLHILHNSYTETTEYSFYYYNVVTWLDRFLFCPKTIKDYYKKRLYKSIENYNNYLSGY